jgi:hypothetical protein
MLVWGGGEGGGKSNYSNQKFHQIKFLILLKWKEMERNSYIIEN